MRTGNLHIGHALNKVLKDFITRSQQMMGRDARYVPGWDCHGLPIEWKIEEAYRKAGRDKDEVDTVEFRQECRKFAEGWVDIQREEFKRLGVIGKWEAPYLTMDFHAEAVIAAEFMKLLMNGSLYQGSKPVMWSPVEKTALAEAEVEYHDHSARHADVRLTLLRVGHAPTVPQGGRGVHHSTTTRDLTGPVAPGGHQPTRSRPTTGGCGRCTTRPIPEKPRVRRPTSRSTRGWGTVPQRSPTAPATSGAGTEAPSYPGRAGDRSPPHRHTPGPPGPSLAA